MAYNRIIGRLIVTATLISVAASVQGAMTTPPGPTSDTRIDPQMVAALNGLRNEINALYGYRDGVPRINLGPCGRFAKAFYEQWNSRFPAKARIVFVMASDGKLCHHVLVQLPDRSFFDGGNGVITERALARLYSGSHIDSMARYDERLLDKRSYGLDRKYPLCANYDPGTTAALIEKALNSAMDRRP